MTQIFDRDRVRLQSARETSGADFLWRHIARALQDRLLDIKRDFAVGVEIGPACYVLTDDFLRRKNVAQPFVVSALRNGGQAVIDEEFLPFKRGSLDVLISLGSLHWVNDLPGALLQMRQALKPDGVLLAAMFGGETLGELRDVLAQTENAQYGGISPRVSPFASLPDMAVLMQRAGFALPVVDQEKLTVTYESLPKLIADLRGMGQGNAVARRNGKILSRDFWFAADADYRARYATDDGRLRATAEILYLIGWAPDASQQQPLKPGSATHRLADVLRTEEIGTEDFV